MFDRKVQTALDATKPNPNNIGRRNRKIETQINHHHGARRRIFRNNQNVFVRNFRYSPLQRICGLMLGRRANIMHVVEFEGQKWILHAKHILENAGSSQKTEKLGSMWKILLVLIWEVQRLRRLCILNKILLGYHYEKAADQICCRWTQLGEHMFLKGDINHDILGINCNYWLTIFLFLFITVTWIGHALQGPQRHPVSPIYALSWMTVITYFFQGGRWYEQRNKKPWQITEAVFRDFISINSKLVEL